MILNESLANIKNVATPFGYMDFNENGESFDLKPEEQKIIGGLNGFNYVEDKKPEPAKEEVELEEKKPTKKKKSE